MDGQTCYVIYKRDSNPRIIGLDEVDGLDDDWKVFEGKPARSSIDYQYMTTAVERIAPWVMAVYLVPCLKNGTGHICGGVAVHDTRTLIVTYNNLFFNSILDTLYHELFHAVQKTLTDGERTELYDTVWDRSINFQDTYLNSSSETTARQFASMVRYIEDGGFVAAGHDKTAEFMIRVYNGAWARQVQAEWAELAAAQAKAERRARLISAARNLVFG